MAVNSLEFLLFFAVVFCVHYALLSKSSRGQNLLLLAASWAYYALAGWKTLPFLLGVTVVFYALGLRLPKIADDRKAFRTLAAGVVLGIGGLVYAKYLGFFTGIAGDIATLFGPRRDWTVAHVLVPLGISFFTFRVISYLVEVYRGKIEPERDFVAFAVYVSFFPCLLSGPIDRPNLFLPQLGRARRYDHDLVADGFRQVLWGVFKKTVVADNLAVVVDAVWADHSKMPGGLHVLAAFLYTLQMYFDFSGYSDMAIGAAKALGLRVVPNFRYPFFATNVAEYWRGWHMSLTSWLTEYVFMPLNVAFRDWGRFGLCLAIVVNLVTVGIWHGANWTFAVFGLYHGLLFVPLVLSGAFQKKAKLETGVFGLPKPATLAKMALTFVFVTLGLVVFRAESVGQAVAFLRGMFGVSRGGFDSVAAEVVTKVELRIGILFAILALVAEWYRRDKEYALSVGSDELSLPRRWALYYSIVAVAVLFGAAGGGFIYARF